MFQISSAHAFSLNILSIADSIPQILSKIIGPELGPIHISYGSTQCKSSWAYPSSRGNIDIKNDGVAYTRGRNVYRNQLRAHVKIPKGDPNSIANGEGGLEDKTLQIGILLQSMMHNQMTFKKIGKLKLLRKKKGYSCPSIFQQMKSIVKTVTLIWSFKTLPKLVELVM